MMAQATMTTEGIITTTVNSMTTMDITEIKDMTTTQQGKLNLVSIEQ